MSLVLTAPADFTALDAYVMEEEPKGFAENGLVSYSGVFMDEEDDDSEEEDSEGQEEDHSHASHLTDDEEHSQHEESDDVAKKGWNAFESLEEVLCETRSRRFSFDLSNIDMQALEHLTNLPGSGPTSRRGSFSLTVMDAEALMPKLFPKAAPSIVEIKEEEVMPMEEEDDDSSSSRESVKTEREDPPSLSSSTSASTVCSSPTTPIKRSKRRLAKVAAAAAAAAAAEAAALAAAEAASTIPAPMRCMTASRKSSGGGASCDDFTPLGIGKRRAAASGAGSTLKAEMTSSAPTGYTLPVPLNDGIKRVGIYTIEERRVRVAKFQAKRKRRVWRKKIKYDCRKKLADNRPRVKGRFVKREDEVDIALGNAAQGMDQNAFLSQLGELLDEEE